MFPFNLFPFNQNMKQMMNGMKPEQLEKFTQEMINKMMSNQMEGMTNPQDLFKNLFPETNFQSSSSPNLKYSIFDTHEHVFVRINIQSEEWLNSMKICHTANQIIIEHIPNQDDKHSLTLPAIVKKKGATANYKDSVLEIKIPKSVDMQYSEIDVTELF